MKYFKITKSLLVITSFLYLNQVIADSKIECLNRKNRWDYPTSNLAIAISKRLNVKTCNGNKFKSFVKVNYPSLKIITTGETEDSYNETFCKSINGATEWNKVDCITDKYAIEVDRAKKWREAIGQSLHYAYKTKKKPGIALITSKSQKDKEYLDLLKKVIKYTKLEIKIWLMPK